MYFNHKHFNTCELDFALPSLSSIVFTFLASLEESCLRSTLKSLVIHIIDTYSSTLAQKYICMYEQNYMSQGQPKHIHIAVPVAFA